MKAPVPEGSTEPEPFGNTEAGLSVVDDAGGNKLGVENVGAGGVVADVSALGFAYAGFKNMEEEVEAKADDEGPAGLIDETAGLSAASG